MPNGKFEQPPLEKPPEIKKEEKMETEDKKLEPVTLKEMEKWQELKKAEFQLISRGAFPEHPERQKIQGELKGIEEKREMEKEKLVGPAFDRESLLTNSEKQKNCVDFLKGWNQLDEKEQFNRLNRVHNELEKMHPSTDAEQRELQESIAIQEKAGRNYLKIMKEAEAKSLLKEKDYKKWGDLLQKDEAEGFGSLSKKEMNKLYEFRNRGKLEVEKLIGPNLNNFEILASPSLRKHYLSSLEKWNDLDVEEKEGRLEKTKVIADNLRRDGFGPIGLPEKRVFEMVRGAVLYEKYRKI